MFTPYINTSGGQDRGFSVVSGWLSTHGRWEDFEIEWRHSLAKYHVPYFHMKEFAHCRGPFEEWKGNESARMAFLKDLTSIMKGRVVYGCTSVLRHAVFNEVNKRYMLEELVGNPYALCARNCVAHMNSWLKEGGFDHPTECVFDDGEDSKGHLIKAMAVSKLSVPVFRPSRDEVRGGVFVRGLTPLQAADFPVYEVLEAFRTMGESAPVWAHAKSMMGLASIATWCGEYEEPDLERFCEEVAVGRRSRIPDSRPSS